MLKDYLDSDVYHAIIRSFSFANINEVRMRANHNLIVVVGNKQYYIKNADNQYVVVTKLMLDNFIRRASENSIYAYNESIINGYITLPKGIRVGLAGNVVIDNDKVITIKEFQSVNIRIPHIKINCSLPVYEYIVDENVVHNTLIISPPGAGKTTFIRDIVYQMNEHALAKNVLVADERNEICSVLDGVAQLDLGNFCDIYTNCSKTFAFKNGIRSMRPDVIVTDEIDIDKDLSNIIEAINCGVNVIATIHAKDIKQLRQKSGFEKVLTDKLFTRYIILCSDVMPGRIANIYDEKLNCIYVGRA